jgi:hypothetical protein
VAETRTRDDDLKNVTPTEARQAEKPGRMRYVLGIGLPLAAIALFVGWLVW